MKQLLITGFDPFGGEAINPSREAVMRLPDVIGSWTLCKREIPTVFGKAAEAVLAAAEECHPHAILCVGQAGGRAAVTPEVVAINLREATISDNEGNRPVNRPVAEGGPAAYFSTLPVREMVAAAKAADIPAALSYSAGAFVCNDVLYTLLHHYDESEVKVGFVHIPYIPEQGKEDAPSLPLSRAVEALERMILGME